MDDAELVDRAIAGDEAAFELLVRRHAPAAWRLARAVLRNEPAPEHAAEEAVQDAFLKAHRALPSWRRDAAFSTWLLAITRRVCLDRLRLVRPDLVSLDDVRRERDEVEDAVLRVALEEAIDRLPPAEREAFVLVDVLGHSREDAAGVVGVPASTMRSRVARARARLATELVEPPIEDRDAR